MMSSCNIKGERGPEGGRGFTGEDGPKGAKVRGLEFFLLLWVGFRERVSQQPRPHADHSTHTLVHVSLATI